MMSELFLTNEELKDLTGYCYARQQCKWLSKEGIPFRMNRMGHPKVNRCLFVNSNVSIQPRDEEPNFGAI
ncbi:DUF4224 domain-containing protein [Siccibacter colletis]|nr:MULTISPECIES: DUF4224 domain-containing protein [Siccibacter]WNN49848.1 DUF4224 domain-containing protein [Siccibacter colletis]